MAIIFFIMTVAVIFTALASYGHKDRALRTMGLIFLFIYFPLWAFSLWIPTQGRVWYGIAFVDLLVFALFLTFFIFTVTSLRGGRKETEGELLLQTEKGKEEAAVKRSYSMAFMIFLAFMILAIIVGSFRPGI